MPLINLIPTFNNNSDGVLMTISFDLSVYNGFVPLLEGPLFILSYVTWTLLQRPLMVLNLLNFSLLVQGVLVAVQRSDRNPPFCLENSRSCNFMEVENHFKMVLQWLLLISTNLNVITFIKSSSKFLFCIIIIG